MHPPQLGVLFVSARSDCGKNGGSGLGRLMTYQAVSDSVAEAAIRAGRRPEDITLVVISKGRDLRRISELYDQGVRDFGENRAQELAAKAIELPDDIRWHYVGPLQTNKVRMVRPVAHLLHSMDRIKLARMWTKNTDSPVPALAQVNIGSEPQKHGISPRSVEETVARLAEEGVELRGLMAMAPLVPNPELARPFFRRLRELSEKLRERYPAIRELSMGMTDDYEVAIEEGATIVRVGRAVFGKGS